MSFGFGDGAVSLAGQPGFGLASDYQADRGGAVLNAGALSLSHVSFTSNRADVEH